MRQNTIKFNFDKQIILVRSDQNRQWDDKTQSISIINKAFYYGNHSGFDIVFKSGAKYFYKIGNILIINKVSEIDISQTDVYFSGELIVANRLELFEKGFYRAYFDNKVLVSNNFKLVTNKNKNNFTYLDELAAYANTIARDDEPLYYLANTYKSTKVSKDSILHDYLNGRVSNDQNKSPIILPFDFNLSQLSAIEKALSSNISIIEGPPGTGKTQTILNLVCNVVAQNKTCAVISNNNTAIDNIYEKLKEANLDFIAASLGRKDLVNRFFEEKDNEDTIEKLSKIEDVTLRRVENSVYNKTFQYKTILGYETQIANLRAELQVVRLESENLTNLKNSNFEVNTKLESNHYRKIIQRIEKPSKLGFFERISFRIRFKIWFNKNNQNDLLDIFEHLFYTTRIKEILSKIDEIKNKLVQYNKIVLLREIKTASRKLLDSKIIELARNSNKNIFTKNNYKNLYDDFVRKYPIVLSTSYSLLNNIGKHFMFDYLIIDEASQSDLLSSCLAMKISKKLVVVGDSRQLQQIDEERLFEKSKELCSALNIQEAYKYHANSILISVKSSNGNIPVTLLREHYRSAPDIINFCNIMFYEGQLIPMRQNSGTHIEIIKTVPGNHARRNPNGSGLYNRREVDEIIKLTNGTNHCDLGIISPYRFQVETIQKALEKEGIEVDTIHRFQGRQKKEIILSFVANSLDKKEKQVENRLYDFLTNEKLLNVAVSRAQDKITAIVSDKIYHSENNVISDFIKYSERLYGSSITKLSKVTSVFDYLYAEKKKDMERIFQENPNGHRTELLMNKLVNDTLKKYPKIGFVMHVRLSKIVNNLEGFNNQEIKYISHPWTHVDFLFYNRVTKENLFVIEVDGVSFHEQNPQQVVKDELKDRVIAQNGLAIFRFKTNESGEKARLIAIMNKYTY